VDLYIQSPAYLQGVCRVNFVFTFLLFTCIYQSFPNDRFSLGFPTEVSFSFSTSPVSATDCVIVLRSRNTTILIIKTNKLHYFSTSFWQSRKCVIPVVCVRI